MMMAANLGGASTLSAIPQAFTGVQQATPPERVDAFGSALERQGLDRRGLEVQTLDSAIEMAASARGATPVANVSAGERVNAIGSSDPALADDDGSAESDDVSRARRGLGLEPGESRAAPEGGDMILNGIQRLRGVFDARQDSINSALNSGPLNSNQLMAVQMEVTNFTLLVDISSKLTGKSTQAFETLMKGQ